MTEEEDPPHMIEHHHRGDRPVLGTPVGEPIPDLTPEIIEMHEHCPYCLISLTDPLHNNIQCLRSSYEMIRQAEINIASQQESINALQTEIDDLDFDNRGGTRRRRRRRRYTWYFWLKKRLSNEYTRLGSLLFYLVLLRFIVYGFS